MKTFHPLAIAAAILAVPSLVPAQTAPPSSPLSSALSRLGGTFLFDSARRGKPTLAVTYEISRLTNVLGKGFDLSVSGIAGASGGGAAVGTGLLYRHDFRLGLADELRGTASLTIGPALLYGTDGGRARLGFVAGLGFRF